MSPRAPATIEQATQVLAAWPDTRGARVEALGAGLINDTFAVQTTTGLAWVLQRVHPVFAPQIHDNIALVTERLAQRGLATPRLVRTSSGALWSTVDGIPWRVTTRVAGVTFDAVRSPAQAAAAARLLGRFHSALDGLLPSAFTGTRPGVHDTPRHLAALADAIAQCPAHRLHDDVARLGHAILQGQRLLSPLPDAPPRVVHGDPKLNNVVFRGGEGGDNEAVAWIDLDTVGPSLLAYEMGDAWRSWCNPAGEDEAVARFDESVYAASVEGWSGALQWTPTPAEREGLVLGVEWITLELSARFAADALREQYFGFDAKRFAGRGEHNLVRARGQWALHEAVVGNRGTRESAVRLALDRRS